MSCPGTSLKCIFILWTSRIQHRVQASNIQFAKGEAENIFSIYFERSVWKCIGCRFRGLSEWPSCFCRAGPFDLFTILETYVMVPAGGGLSDADDDVMYGFATLTTTGVHLPDLPLPFYPWSNKIGCAATTPNMYACHLAVVWLGIKKVSPSECAAPMRPLRTNPEMNVCWSTMHSHCTGLQR
jgi:hypothetical protein